MADQKARAILFDMYWSAAGWKTSPRVSPDDFAYAVQAGYMFPPDRVSHDDLTGRIHAARQHVSLAAARDGFLASLTARTLDLRSALGSFAIASHYPIHAFEVSGAQGDFLCHICGVPNEDDNVDLNVLNFERHKWGGVRRLDPRYIAFDRGHTGCSRCQSSTAFDGL